MIGFSPIAFGINPTGAPGAGIPDPTTTLPLFSI